MLHVLFGAVAGAVVGAASVAVTSLVRGKPINWKKVGSAALGGAAVGAIGAATFGAGALAGSAALKTTGMVVAGASGGAIEQGVDNAFHGRELTEGVGEAAAVGGVLGLMGSGARGLRKPLTRLVRSKAFKRGARFVARHGRKLTGQAWRGIKRFGSSAARTIRRKARGTKVNLALGRRRLARAAKPITEPVARATQRYVKDPFKKHVGDPLKRRVVDPLKKHVGDPLKRRVIDPTKRALAPFAARIGRTRAGQATKKLWGRYMRALDTNPIRTKALTSAGISVTGDLIAQTTDDTPGINWKRTAFRGGFALAYSGPVGHYWFNAVDRIVPGNGPRAMLTKVLIDQGIMAPFGATVFFTSYGMVVDGEKPREAFNTATDDVRKVVPKGWAFWGPFHSINFSRIPLNLRKPVADAAGLVWSVIFSRVAFENDEAAEGAEPTPTAGTVTHTPANTAGTCGPPVDAELEASLDGMIDSFTPRKHVGAGTSCATR